MVVTMTDTIAAEAAIDMDAVNEFAFRIAGDIGATMHAITAVIGDRLGLYKALAEGPADAVALAARTGCDRRYLQEWLDAQAASGYCDYDPGTGRYRLTPVQAFCLADEGGPAFMLGGMQSAAACAKGANLITEAFRTGAGVGWHEHDPDLFTGVERFFRPGYVANLVGSWLPALDGVVAKLEAGARVADIGCGHGASTILMAQAFPRSTFDGFDYHHASIQAARQQAEKAGVADRVTFEPASASEFPGSGYDLACIFDALHDMGDPVGAAARIRAALAPDGTLMVVEPAAGDRPEDNHNPVGRIFYSASTLTCVTNSKSQPVALALGAQAGPARLIAVLREAGFGRVRRAAETPFNHIFEARP
jgi:SAM-dependent methyltransferase